MKAFSLHSMPVSSDQPRILQDSPPDLAAQIEAVMPGYAQLPAEVVEADLLLIQEKFPKNRTRRLVVLVPPGEIDETALARRVWQLAAISGTSVLYLALSPDFAETAYQRRRLAGLAAFTTDLKVRAHASLSAEKNWRQALERTRQPGDLLVCLASHQVSEHLLRRRKLGEQLAATEVVPVYLVGGIKTGPVPQDRKAIKTALGWTAFLLLLAAFFGVQAGIQRSTSGTLSTILLCLTVVVEMYMLLKINEWIG